MKTRATSSAEPMALPPWPTAGKREHLEQQSSSNLFCLDSPGATSQGFPPLSCQALRKLALMRYLSAQALLQRSRGQHLVLQWCDRCRQLDQRHEEHDIISPSSFFALTPVWYPCVTTWLSELYRGVIESLCQYISHRERAATRAHKVRVVQGAHMPSLGVLVVVFLLSHGANHKVLDSPQPGVVSKKKSANSMTGYDCLSTEMALCLVTAQRCLRWGTTMNRTTRDTWIAISPPLPACSPVASTHARGHPSALRQGAAPPVLASSTRPAIAS
jgi:hypothetical protein